jgi:hypothetical protein
MDAITQQGKLTRMQIPLRSIHTGYLQRCRGRFAPSTIRQRVQASKLAHPLAADPRRLGY